MVWEISDLISGYPQKKSIGEFNKIKIKYYYLHYYYKGKYKITLSPLTRRKEINSIPKASLDISSVGWRNKPREVTSSVSDVIRSTIDTVNHSHCTPFPISRRIGENLFEVFLD